MWDLIDGETDDIAHIVTERKTLGSLVDVAKKLVPAVYLSDELESKALSLLDRVKIASSIRNQYLHAEYVGGSDGVVGRLRYSVSNGHPQIELRDVDLTLMQEETAEMNLLTVKVLELSNEVGRYHHARRVKEGRLRRPVPGAPDTSDEVESTRTRDE